MFSDDFLLGNSLHTQKKNFQHFLCHGLIDELQNHFPFSTSFSGYSLELVIDAPNYVLKKPKLSSHQALEDGHHYKTELYVPATWLINNIPMAPTTFLFLGEIPMMTEEGHFIFNGSSRNVVGQLVRSPGIYYKVRLGKGNFRRHLVSFLSQNGCWFRLWIDRWGRCWGRINKMDKIPLFALIRAFGFHDQFLSRMLSNQFLFEQSRQKFPTDQLWFIGKLYNAVVFIYMDLHGTRSKSPYYLKACEFFFRTFFQPKTYSFGSAGRRFLDQKLGRAQQLTQTLKPEDFLDALEKLVQLEYGFIWVDNIDHLQNRRVRTISELFQNELRNGLQEIERQFRKKVQKIQDLLSLPDMESPLLKNLPFYKKNQLPFEQSAPYQFSQKSQKIRYGSAALLTRSLGPKVIHSSIKQKRIRVENFLQQNFVEPTYLAPRYQHTFGLQSQKSFYSISPVSQPSSTKTVFIKNLKANTFTKHSVSQKVRVRIRKNYRLKHHLQNVKGKSLSSWLLSSTGLQKKYKIELANLTSPQRFASSNQSFRDRNKKNKKVYYPLRSPKWSFRPIVYPHFSMTQTHPFFISKPPPKFLQSLIESQCITKAFNQFFGLHPLSQLLDQSNPLSAAAHRRRFTSLGPGGVNRDAGLAVRDIHPSHYGRLCPIETPEGKNAGLVHSLAMYARINAFGTLETPFFYQYSDHTYRKSVVQAPPEQISYLSETSAKTRSLDRNLLSKFTYLCETKRTSEPFVQNAADTSSLSVRETCRFLAAEEEFFFTKGQPLFFARVAPSEFYSKESKLNNSFLNERASVKNLNLPFANNGHAKSLIQAESCQFRAISPIQILSLATSLIPFLEHNDANRALMGSNMQRQAVPLLYREKAIVGTGFEKSANQGIVAKKSGIIYSSNSTQILLRTDSGIDIYPLSTFSRSNQATALQEQSFVTPGEPILQGTSFADREGTYGGELAIGRNLLLGYMPWEGYNFEDAVVISERLVQEDMYTSVHLERYTVSLDQRQNEQLTQRPPNVDIDQTKNLDSDGIIQKGVFVDKEGILVGKQILIPDQKITPSFRLRAKIFQQNPPFYDDTSYRLTRGSGGKILRVQLKFHSRPQMDAPFRFWYRDRYYRLPSYQFGHSMQPTLGTPRTRTLNTLENKSMSKLKSTFSDASPFLLTSNFPKESFPIQTFPLDLWVEKSKFDLFYIPARLTRLPYLRHNKLSKRVQKEIRNLNFHKRVISKETLSASLSSIQILIATKRRIQIGDKISGRHGNKGIVSLILPRAHMPYLQDGTSLDMVLNPLGVPSRMNLGQLFESLLGLAGKHLRQSYKIVPFDEFHASFLSSKTKTPLKRSLNSASPLEPSHNPIRLCASEISRTLVYQKLVQAKKRTGYKWLFDLNSPGKSYIFDGRSGEAFFQPVTVGISYMLKLVHLVDDKIHARSTGPYALITQQPLRGKARDGGQRLGEMEVWALEGFGVACILQELLTIKSDDLDGRKKIFQSIIDNTFQLELSFVTNGPLKWGRPLEFAKMDRPLWALDTMNSGQSMHSTGENKNEPVIDITLLDKERPSQLKQQDSKQIGTPFNNEAVSDQFWQLEPHQTDQGLAFMSHGPRFSYKTRDPNQHTSGKNIPESFQVLCAELQALCLDVFSIKI